MTTDDKLAQGRRHFKQQAWFDAYLQLSDEDQQSPLEADDLDRLARAAYLIGKDEECTNSWIRAHSEFLRRGQPIRAARCAFWLGMVLLNKGERARGGGWISRARRLVDETPQECAEQGLLLIPVALEYLRQGDASKARTTFGEASEIGNRFQDRDLMTLSRLGSGQALIQLGQIAEGIALLDEAMVDLESDQVSPIIVGIVYCAVIETCHKIFDLRRAQEWTTALSRWCDAHPELVPYRGQCLVRRAEIMQLHGEWPEALKEVQRACELLSRPPGEPAAGLAYYQLAELYRLQGEYAKAEEAYRQANQWGKKPQPGLAQLRLAQGQLGAALAAIRRVLTEVKDPMARARILSVFVDITLSAPDLQAARSAGRELADISKALHAPYLQAVSARVQGAILLSEGNCRKALDQLRKAYEALEELEAPYELARVRVLTGLAYRELGDEDTSEMELDAARSIFKQLGASPDITRVDSLTLKTSRNNTHDLTSREIQVLRLVAAGKTNKEIASELFISQRTVDRHVSNIFTKLDVSSRAAATAYAYKHNLV